MLFKLAAPAVLFIWDPYNNGRTDRDVVQDDTWALPEEQCVMRGVTTPKGKRQFWGKQVPNKLNIPTSEL